MLNVEKQVAHWRHSAQEDWEAAMDLAERGRLRHSFFFAHLALEKLLKAHLCRHTGGVAPRIHSLLRLAEQTGLSFTAEQKDFLGRFDRFQMEARYPDAVPMELDSEAAGEEQREAARIFEWLGKQF